MLQAWGRDMAKLGFIGIWNGIPPVTIRQRQLVPLVIIVLSALQQSSVGEVPLLLLFVKKFTHGVKLVIIGPVHGVLIIWPSTGCSTAAIKIIDRSKFEKAKCL